MNANELADELDHVYELSNIFECKAGADTIRQQQAEIEALKKQVKAQDNSIAAADMMIAQFEDKFGDYEKVINGSYVKVRPHEFIAAVTGKEHIVGQPIMYAEWPMRVEMNANEPICDKDPRGCWSVRCQLGKNCKNTHPAKTLTDEVYFCSRCGKRLGDGIHTCTPPTDILRKASEK